MITILQEYISLVSIKYNFFLTNINSLNIVASEILPCLIAFKTSKPGILLELQQASTI